MSMNPDSSSPDSPHAKPSFHKRSNHAASRKYRRHSPISGSSSDGSPKHGRSPSSDRSREHSTKVSDNRSRRKHDGREIDRESGRGRPEKGGGDSYRYSEKQSIGSSHDRRKHGDHSRHYKHANEGERGYTRSSYSGRESRSSTVSDNRRREVESERSRDYWPDKHIKDKPHYKEFRSKDKDRDDAEDQKRKDISDRATSGRGRSNSVVDEIRGGENREKRSFRDYRDTDTKASAGQERQAMEKKKHEDGGSDRHVERYKRELDVNEHRSSPNFSKKDWRNEQKEDETGHGSDNHDSSAKKLKMVSSGCSASKFTSKADDRLPSNSKQVQETVSAMRSERAQSCSNEAEGAQDLNAAKVAAMRAAELVNLNLKGSGYMSTDQKKKLLWGNKKNVVVEESGNRWDTSLFPDKERQEKFYKLMGVKGDLKIEQKPEGKDGNGLLAEKQQELQLDLEKQYTAGLRRRDGRTVGLGL